VKGRGALRYIYVIVWHVFGLVIELGGCVLGVVDALCGKEEGPCNECVCDVIVEEDSILLN
jgi:hypothetical protein